MAPSVLTNAHLPPSPVSPFKSVQIENTALKLGLIRLVDIRYHE